jgi:hypothetical protein
MTLREFGQNFSESYNDTTVWFSDGWEKLVNGQFLDLTIGQALLILFIVWAFFETTGSSSNSIPVKKEDHHTEE